MKRLLVRKQVVELLDAAVKYFQREKMIVPSRSEKYDFRLADDFEWSRSAVENLLLFLGGHIDIQD